MSAKNLLLTNTENGKYQSLVLSKKEEGFSLTVTDIYQEGESKDGTTIDLHMKDVDRIITMLKAIQESN